MQLLLDILTQNIAMNSQDINIIQWNINNKIKNNENIAMEHE